MPDAEPGTHAGESPAMRAFLQARGADVLRRGIAALETCSPESLPGEAHRLAGTLGIFGFDTAGASLRELQRFAESPDSTEDAIAAYRTRTLDALRELADEQKGPR